MTTCRRSRSTRRSSHAGSSSSAISPRHCRALIASCPGRSARLTEFTIALGDQAELQVVHFKPTLVLDENARRQLVAALDELREAELSWLEVTFVFKPLLG